MGISPLTAEDVERWIDMRLLLLPYRSRQEFSAEVERWKDWRTGVFIATDDGEPFGFSEVSMRDRAPECSTSPVGDLEGWWVADGHRQQGVGAAMWARGGRVSLKLPSSHRFRCATLIGPLQSG